MSAAEVVTALAAARKAVQLYPPTHPAHGEALEALTTAVERASSSGQLVINWHEGRLYHDSLVLPDDTHGAASVAESFEARSIESISMNPGFGPADALGLTEVLSLRPSPQLNIEAELAARDVVSVSLSFLEDDDPEKEERDRQREADRAMHHRALTALRRIRQQFSAGGSGDLSGTGELVEQVMSRMFADPSAVMGLATIRGNGDASLFHSLNVMIYSLVLGHRLGLPEEGLSSLGMSALLHDIGKAAFIEDDPSQQEQMRAMHPKVGAEILQRAGLEDPAPMLVAYEHHMAGDGGGWPEREPGYVAHPYSRMVSIANRYDNLVSPPAGQDPLTPDRAIIQVLREGSTVLDPFFSRLFANALGVFPVGCLVRLSNLSVAVVVRTAEDPLAPVIRIAYDPMGNEQEAAEELDLAASDLHIVEVIDPDSLQVQVADKL